MKLSYSDIEKYISLFLQDPEYQENLQKWIQDRNTTAEAFVEQVAVKSQNNFMYLRYLLPAIANGQYNNWELKQLPNGLQEYYQNHWVRMEMESAPNEFKVIILFILKEIKTLITSSIIAEIADEDKYDVEKLFDDWVEYVKLVQFQGAMCYKIYHPSFADFLEKKKELERERKLFKEVNRRIAEYFSKYRQSKKEAGQSNG